MLVKRRYNESIGLTMMFILSSFFPGDSFWGSKLSRKFLCCNFIDQKLHVDITLKVHFFST